MKITKLKNDILEQVDNLNDSNALVLVKKDKMEIIFLDYENQENNSFIVLSGDNSLYIGVLDFELLVDNLEYDMTDILQYYLIDRSEIKVTV